MHTRSQAVSIEFEVETDVLASLDAPGGYWDAPGPVLRLGALVARGCPFWQLLVASGGRHVFEFSNLLLLNRERIPTWRSFLNPILPCIR